MDLDFHQTKYAPCKSVTIFLVESNAQHGAWKKSGNVLGAVSTADINPRIPGANLQISLILVADLTDNIKTEAPGGVTREVFFERVCDRLPMAPLIH